MIRFKPLEQEWRRDSFHDAWNGIYNPFVCNFSGGGGSQSGSTTQTTSNTSVPWAAQQPYLTAGFGAAQDLLGQQPPQQQNPVAPFNSAQDAALYGITQTAANGSPIAGAANNFGTSLLDGSYLNSNPANGYFGSLAGSNLGLTGPGSATLANFANGGGAGSDTLNKFANGGYFSNGYSDATAQNIMSQVIPQVAASFNKGNAINNPQAARSAAEGVTTALAPIEYSNYQTQEQLAQQAAGTLGANALTGATGANSSEISGGGLQATGAAGLANNYQDSLAKMVQGQALAPQTQGQNYADLQQMFNAGSAQQGQTQNEASGQAASYNFSQMSPYQQLQAYINAIGGNYGQTSNGSTTTPYFTNPVANGLGGALGGAALASAFPATFGSIGGALGIGGAGAGAGLGALLAFL